MKIFFKIVVQIGLFIIPWKIRRICLNKFFGFEIDKTAKIGFSIILADKFIMSQNTNFGHFTFCKNIDLLTIKNNSRIGSLNFITGFNSKNLSVYGHRKNRSSELVIEEHSAITSRHFLDCNGGIYIGKYTTLAGIRSTFLTHSIDIYQNRQDVSPIKIGDYCFIGTGCILLGGSGLPNFSVLGAGAVLSKRYEEENYLYGGVPARQIKVLAIGEVAYFLRDIGFVK